MHTWEDIHACLTEGPLTKCLVHCFSQTLAQWWHPGFRFQGTMVQICPGGVQKKPKYADVINERPLIEISYLFTLVKCWTRFALQLAENLFVSLKRKRILKSEYRE